MLDIDPATVKERGALRPGQIFVADTGRGRVLKDGEVKAYYTRRLPYRRWVDENKITLHGLFNDVAPVFPEESRLLHREKLFGYTREDLVRLKSGTIRHFRASEIKMQFSGSGQSGELEERLELACKKAIEAVKAGNSLLVLSDRDINPGMAPIPALLMVSTLHQRLILEGLRTSASLIVETGETREVHDLAVLLGFGATAVCPYMAFEIIADMALKGHLGDGTVGVTKALENYINALCKGLLKIMSKMGISTLRSYRNAQVFEAIGLNAAMVDKYFTGTSSRVGGIGVDEIAREYMAQLGFRTMDDMVGRSDLINVREAVDFWKAKGLDFSALLVSTHNNGHPVRCTGLQDHGIDHVMDRELIELAKDALEHRKKVEISKPIRNLNRTVGTMLSGVIAKKYGFKGLKEDTIVCRFDGSAGQSFGAFAAHGVTMYLRGEANDYLGKGLSGGKIIVSPFENTNYDPSENVICGNVLMYGAVEGEENPRRLGGKRL